MNVLAYLKLLAACAVFSIGVGFGSYVKGRSDGRAALLGEQAKATAEIHAQDSALRQDVEAHNRGSALGAAQTEIENDAVQESLDVPEPSDSNDFASDQWVRDLGRLR